MNTTTKRTPMTCRIGKQTRQFMELLEAHGPMGVLQISTLLGGVDDSNLRKRLAKAVEYKLCTFVPGHSHISSFSIYTATPDWREVADGRAAKPQLPTRVYKPRRKVDHGPVTKWTGVVSVFQMGAQ